MESISFARGVPAPERLALEELADCARAAIERDGATDAGTTARPAATRLSANGSPTAMEWSPSESS